LDNKLFYLPFAVFDGIGVITFRNLMQFFKSAKNIWECNDIEICNSPLPKHLHEKFLDFRRKFSIEEYVERLRRNCVWFWITSDAEYPELLREIYDPPFVLFYKSFSVGAQNFVPDPTESREPRVHNCEPLQQNKYTNLCVVGSRKITNYGVRVVEDLIGGLYGQNICIVSGLALGVDAAAHKTALNSKLPTVAVLGCGLDIMYPRENARLSEEILEAGGYILSEVPMGRFVTRGIFPARNRIVSGMSKAILIVEAAEKSGSLITASYALEQGRDVYVVPGPIDSPNSKGIFELLKKGVTPVSSSSDILQELGFSLSAKSTVNENYVKITRHFENENEKKIYDLLTNNGQTHINEMCKSLEMKIADLSSILTMMEINGVVRNAGNMEYTVN